VKTTGLELKAISAIACTSSPFPVPDPESWRARTNNASAAWPADCCHQAQQEGRLIDRGGLG
jgi:hypothetical protein